MITKLYKTDEQHEKALEVFQRSLQQMTTDELRKTYMPYWRKRQSVKHH